MMIQHIHRNKLVPKGFKKTFAFNVPDGEEFFADVNKLLKGKEIARVLEVQLATDGMEV